MSDYFGRYPLKGYMLCTLRSRKMCEPSTILYVLESKTHFSCKSKTYIRSSHSQVLYKEAIQKALARNFIKKTI